MAESQLPSIDRLRQILRYEPETGKLFWLERPESMFVGGPYKPSRRAASWNSRCAGKEAFTARASHGYREGAVDNKKYLAHRIIWALHYGSHPPRHVDHINGDKLDNRIANLRDVDPSMNLRNALGKSNNTSGVTGVNWRDDKRKWRARIMVNYKETTIGHFDTFEEAVAAREAAAKRLGFTQRHGTFA